MKSKIKSLGAMVLAAGMITGMSAFAAEADMQKTVTVSRAASADLAEVGTEGFFSYFADEEGEHTITIVVGEDGKATVTHYDENGNVTGTEDIDIDIMESTAVHTVKVAVLEIDDEIYGVTAVEGEAYEFFKLNEDGTHTSIDQEELDAEIVSQLLEELNRADGEEGITVMFEGEDGKVYGFAQSAEAAGYFTLDENGEAVELDGNNLPEGLVEMISGENQFKIAFEAASALEN